MPALVLPASAAGPAPLAAAVVTDPPHGETVGVVGGGHGLSGPASAAAISGLAVDGAPDGTLLVADPAGVLRVTPSTDRVALVPGTGDLHPTDVAAMGASIVVATPAGVVRVAPDGTRTTLLSDTTVRAVDAGADGIVWVALKASVLRILPDGSVDPATATGDFAAVADLAVTPDGTAAFVIEGAANLWGIYRVTAAGRGARVAGNLQRSDSLYEGFPATSASTASVTSVTTDGSWLTMVSPEYDRVVRFQVGGTIKNIVTYRDASRVTTLGSDLAVGSTFTTGDGPTLAVERFSTTGGFKGRLVGLDPERPWTPDGVLARDAAVGVLAGAASLPSGPTVFATRRGLVREVGADGLLRTRAELPAIRTSGKVALAADGTAYVVTDAGTVVRVPATGAASTITVAGADVVDVEAAADGSLVLADRAGKQVLRRDTDGTTTVLATLSSAPVDLALDGSDVLVAAGGVLRIAPDGTVRSVLAGERYTAVAPIAEGTWLAQAGRVLDSVRLPSGALAPLVLEPRTTVQGQAVGGDLLLTRSDHVERLVDPHLLPEPTPLPVTATPGPGRVSLRWPETAGQVTVRAALDHAPTDPVDGWFVRGPETATSYDVLSTADDGLVPGTEWTFSVFEDVTVLLGDGQATTYRAAPVVVHGAALPDTTPPGAPVEPSVSSSRYGVGVVWDTPTDDDIRYVVVQLLPGTTPPQSPDEGERIDTLYPAYQQHGSAGVPDPVPGQDYAISIFVVDWQGNFSRWSAVARIDDQPPGPPTDVVVTPSHRSAQVTLTFPSDPDFTGVSYAVAKGDSVPDDPAPFVNTQQPYDIGGLVMDTDYTLAIRTHDRSGNVSAPYVLAFHTPLDTTPPGTVTSLAATPADYQVDASWVPPSDDDLASLHASLYDLTWDREVGVVDLGRTATGTTFLRLAGGHEFEVRVTATDLNGLTSPVTTASVRTPDDANGPPPGIDPDTAVVTPTSPTSVTVTVPRPAIPDLRNVVYLVQPVGADPEAGDWTQARSFMSGTPMRATVTLPQRLTAYQLALRVYDYNGNRAGSVLASVRGEVTSAQLPMAPVQPRASSASDNTLAVQWSVDSRSVAATSWSVHATSNDGLSREALVAGTARAATFTDLPGRRTWAATVTGLNDEGVGPSGSTPAVEVGDTTAPPNVTGVKLTPSFDTSVLSWTTPSNPDVAGVVVTRAVGTGSGVEVYRGRGTSYRATGLKAGELYTFTVATVDEFGQHVPPTKATSRQSVVSSALTSKITYPGSATLSGRLTSAGTALPGRTVTIQFQRAGSTTWSTVTTRTTSSTGGYAATVKPSTSGRYRVGYVGSGTRGGAWSTSRSVSVAPKVAMSASRTSFTKGSTATLRTTVGPNHKGRSIRLQRWTGSSWSTLTSRTLSSTSTASVTVKPTSRGTVKYRWVLPAHTDHATGTSPSITLTVR